MGFYDEIKIEKDFKINEILIPKGIYQTKDLCFDDKNNNWKGDNYIISDKKEIILENKKTNMKPSGVLQIYSPTFNLRLKNGIIIEAYDIDLAYKSNEYFLTIPSDMIDDTYFETEWK